MIEEPDFMATSEEAAATTVNESTEDTVVLDTVDSNWANLTAYTNTLQASEIRNLY